MKKLPDKVLVWFKGEVKTPPFSSQARIETGYLLRRLQQGESLSMPQSRPMPSVGSRCHELRINDTEQTWRIIYRIDEDAILIVDIFAKKTNKTPEAVLKRSQQRLKQYDDI
ncbi:MAG: type II toxin-antitoxin system RelE/ParE family toxin [Crocosphaera sp.]|uniref:Uncharacterized protein n=3 Tax=Crocosphaera watsonii TaxID=263511 RepID=T2JIK3_CROWT|nr:MULTISPECIES: type II toxin-antitoxin system RelE/ParE family toxin [Crocosphaera]EHJ13308.1 Transposase-like protein, ISL3 family [Crocosphaera watsonii WH 0003]MCH2247760.1 type II toxin-antitoxin system RelE/ParE family toxin [Crocosphaera sp.]NQZ60666.1 type II toxin-antitoxin system RelE/ParE family toxin [Crocosphaera sp.]CCQ59498.1 transposase [Crocosphaera watsonii WH 0005]CCQ65658.1 hypothetical protein CWATWH0402_3695 [Crocosphaera watsonii WH 0402]